MKKDFFKLLLILLAFKLLSSCESKSNFNVDVSGVQANVDLIRFDKEFYGGDTARLANIKKKYKFLFPESVPDSVWKVKMKDSLLLDLKIQVDSVFPDLENEKNQIKNLFQHIKYYFPDWKEPKIYTLYSDWNYLMRSVYRDTVLFLPLDNYLGADNRIYKGVPNYVRQNLIRKRMPIEIARSIAEKQVPVNKKKDFLSEMIYHGKILYLLDVYLPQMPDYLKIGYDEKKLEWAKENEEDIWKYFISKDYLYSFNMGLRRRFIDLAPYSKFYSEKDMESPGKIGQYTGWQILRSFMKKNKVSLQQMSNTSEEDIFKQSKYKPRK